jgi:hypothetical protein
VLSQWRVRSEKPERGFTTVGTWRGPYGRPSHDGRLLGLKVHQFRRFLDLPARCGQSFEAAFALNPDDAADLAALQNAGWHLVDPRIVASTPSRFRRYVASSAAEFSAAQGVYVETSCGWFSDRTVRYLASGRPAVVQDTGFSRRLPVGAGLLPFTTMEEARRAVTEVQANYRHHSASARVLAEEEFDSDKILGRFVEDVDVAP